MGCAPISGLDRVTSPGQGYSMHTIPIRATTLSPFHYGHLLIQDGTATIPDIIGDRALAFALCAALGMMRSIGVLPSKNYREHLSVMPWRTSVLETDEPRLLPPRACRSDLGVEGGYPDRVRKAATSGNFKEFFISRKCPSTRCSAVQCSLSPRRWTHSGSLDQMRS
jgi:hypothetical protein